MKIREALAFFLTTAQPEQIVSRTKEAVSLPGVLTKDSKKIEQEKDQTRSTDLEVFIS